MLIRVLAHMEADCVLAICACSGKSFFAASTPEQLSVSAFEVTAQTFEIYIMVLADLDFNRLDIHIASCVRRGRRTCSEGPVAFGPHNGRIPWQSKHKPLLIEVLTAVA